MTLRYLSAYNGFLPKETGEVVAFIRKPDEFALNKYVQIVQTDATVGVYLKMGLDEPVRSVNRDLAAWEDGDERPRGEVNKHRFQFAEFSTKRRDYPWVLGYKSIAQASWRPKVVHMDDAISQCMTERTSRVITKLEATSNWGSNYEAANTLNSGAGTWATASDDPSSPNYNAIYKTLLAAAQTIHKGTNGKVRPKDLRCVISPGLAIAMAQSAEMTNYLRQGPAALQVLKVGMSDQEELWTLPQRYKGFEFVVEDAVIVGEWAAASGTEATTNRTYIKSDTSAVLVSRPGGLDADYGTKSYSTIQVYHYGALMEVEAFDDPENRRVKGHVTEDVAEVMPCTQAGFLITGTK